MRTQRRVPEVGRQSWVAAHSVARASEAEEKARSSVLPIRCPRLVGRMSLQGRGQREEHLWADRPNCWATPSCLNPIRPFGRPSSVFSHVPVCLLFGTRFTGSPYPTHPHNTHLSVSMMRMSGLSLVDQPSNTMVVIWVGWGGTG